MITLKIVLTVFLSRVAWELAKYVGKYLVHKLQTVTGFRTLLP